ATERTLGTRSVMTRSPESSSDKTYFCTPPIVCDRCLRDELEAGAGPLRLIERFVGQPEQRLCVARVAGARGDAEAGSHAGHLVADAVDHVARGGLGRLGEDERELVAADAECVVSLAYRLLDRACEHLQGIVAARVTEPVVDALEAVEVAHDQRELAVVAARACDLGLETLDEGAAVQQPRERIVVGE